MPKVKCVFCEAEGWAEDMYYCDHCKIWICSSCVEQNIKLNNGGVKWV